MNKTMTISKFNFDSFFNAIFVSFGLLIVFAFLVKLFTKDEGNILGITIMFVCLVGSLLFLNTFKVLKIKNSELSYYRLFRLTGKTIRFDDFIGLIYHEEVSPYGNIETIYFVNKSGFTAFKINLSLYKNKEDIKNAIPLQEIKKSNWSFGQYLKLISTGRIKI